jgi:hypothetical protein
MPEPPSELVKHESKWKREDYHRFIGVIVAVLALATSLLVREVRCWLHLEKCAVSGNAQVVSWGPNNGRQPGMLIREPHVEFIPWSDLQPELSMRVLRNIDQIPEGSTLRIAPSRNGATNAIIEVVSPTQQVVAHVWIGGNPLHGFAEDGLVRVGFWGKPVEIYATFERHTDGSYVRVVGTDY